MMYNPVVNQAFGFSTADSARYGATGTGNACLVASQVLKANQGTRFIQITSNDGWDMHQNIYAANELPAKGKILDNAVSATDRRPGGQRPVDSTLVVMVGEFGRTVGPLTAAEGPRPLAATVRLLRRRRNQGRHHHRPDQRHRLGHADVRLVAEPLRLSGRHRSHDLLGHGHRLDHASATTTRSAAASSTSRPPAPCNTTPSTSSGNARRLT